MRSLIRASHLVGWVDHLPHSLAMDIDNPDSLLICLRHNSDPQIGRDTDGILRMTTKDAGASLPDGDPLGPRAIEAKLSVELSKILSSAYSEHPSREFTTGITSKQLWELFVGEMLARMSEAGAELIESESSFDYQEPSRWSFQCESVQDAENAAVAFLELSLGRSAEILFQDIGEPASRGFGAGYSKCESESLAAAFAFIVHDAATVALLDLGPEIPAECAVVALSKAELERLDGTLPNFVGPFPGRRLDALGKWLAIRFQQMFGSNPEEGAMDLEQTEISWRIRDDLILLEMKFTGIPRADDSVLLGDSVLQAAQKAMGGMGVATSDPHASDPVASARAAFRSKAAR